MSSMTSADLRKRFLAFYQERVHAIVPSASLLPENDPTTLFTGSGMQPLVPYLLGQPHPLGTRIVNSQKSFRANDIEEVGDNRHTTFFEMLGNWSFGDYFKREQLSWLLAFLTGEVSLDPARLFVTVFRGNELVPRDEESIAIWEELFRGMGLSARVVDDAETSGLQDGRIFSYGEKKNWWSRSGEPAHMPLGEPGGPDSEVFWDFGTERGLHEQSAWKDQPCHVNCDCGRFLEIGNSVFMEYRKTANGFERLAQRNVDFGGGLERIVAAVRDEPDIFRGDLFDRARSVVEEKSGVQYGASGDQTRAFRIVLDHMRAATFLIADGAEPSNKEQGYFTRRLIRRAIRFADTLHVADALCADVVHAFVATYQDAYPNLQQELDRILASVKKEEAQFRKTLKKGESELRSLVDSGTAITGQTAFMLYETYGFPLELTEEVVQELGVTLVHREQFDEARRRHGEQSRTATAGKFHGGLMDHADQTIRLHTAHHLLLKALQIVLGPHVKQRGSNITQERLRLDFSHGEKLTEAQQQEVERLVNEKIAEDLPVIRTEMPREDAERLGAEHEFGQKYPERVSVYAVGPKDATPERPEHVRAFSIEFCGGPHVPRTGVIGRFRIAKEEAVSAGIRRLRGVVDSAPASDFSA